jgi:hypothetical protein
MIAQNHTFFKEKNYTFFSGPGHGWLEVPLKLAKLLDLIKEISVYSYYDAKKEILFLEEDSDAGKFTLKFKEFFKQDAKINFKNIENENFIRNLGRTY